MKKNGKDFNLPYFCLEKATKKQRDMGKTKKAAKATPVKTAKAVAPKKTAPKASTKLTAAGWKPYVKVFFASVQEKEKVVKAAKAAKLTPGGFIKGLARI